MKYTIDASGRTIGRVAAEAASVLIGKNTTSFVRNKAPEISVTVTNCGKAKVTEKKQKQTLFHTYSGYPGGLKEKRLEEVAAKKGMKEVMLIAITGMLPKNKLQAVMLKNLIVSE